MTLLSIICNIALLAICGWLCYENDLLHIKSERDEQWKTAADRKIKELQEENLNYVEI